MKTVEVLARLATLHPAEHGEWAFVREYEAIDAYAIRLFQGQGKRLYRRVAYEVKVSRGDFLQEMKKPEKRATALALSHQMYFAMPAELAAKCLPDVERLAPECGVLAIHPDGHQRDRYWETHCVGAVPRPDVEMLRRAPIRDCEPWSMRQITNLLRRQHSKTERALQAQLDEARQRAHARRVDAERAEAKATEAFDALAALLGHTVEPETVWETKDGRRIAVQRVDPPFGKQGRGSATVHARYLAADGVPMEGWKGIVWSPLGEFLAAHVPSNAVAPIRKAG